MKKLLLFLTIITGISICSTALGMKRKRPEEDQKIKNELLEAQPVQKKRKRDNRYNEEKIQNIVQEIMSVNPITKELKQQVLERQRKAAQEYAEKQELEKEQQAKNTLLSYARENKTIRYHNMFDGDIKNRDDFPTINFLVRIETDEPEYKTISITLQTYYTIQNHLKLENKYMLQYDIKKYNTNQNNIGQLEQLGKQHEMNQEEVEGEE